MHRRLLFLTIVFAPGFALGQAAAPVDEWWLKERNPFDEGLFAHGSSHNDDDNDGDDDHDDDDDDHDDSSVKVSKTAYVNGQHVCGAIRIKNVGWSPLSVSGLTDSLEVHFPRRVTPPPLPPGSTRGWFKVADVPVALALPASVAPRATAIVPYCFSLCSAADSPGTNSMRNVVAVKVTRPWGVVKTFKTRSDSFTPPVLDCRACCLPDGSCTDTLPAGCAAAGGLSRGAGTDCAMTQCIQGCCLADGTCRDETRGACEVGGGNALGLGTTCATASTTCRGACCWFKGCDDDVSYADCRDVYNGTYLGRDTACETQLDACPTGACCFDGNCTDAETDGYHRSQAYCEPSGVYQGDGTTCGTVGATCRGACCWFKGCDDDVSDADCRDLYAGTYLGHGSTCETQLAACPTGACCFDGSCTDSETDGYHRSQAYCEPSGLYLGDGTTCDTSECPRPCCLDDGACAEMERNACFSAGGRPLDPDEAGNCTEVAFYGGCPQACCVLGQCSRYFPIECAIRQGSLQGPGTSCTLDQCPRACCHNDGSCTEERWSDCEAGGGRPQSVHDANGQHIGVNCDILEVSYGGCRQPCCGFGPGSTFCNTIHPDTCRSYGYFPQDVNAFCGMEGLCDGACCFDGRCEEMHWSECEAQGGDPHNPGTDCGFGPLSPCSVISP